MHIKILLINKKKHLSEYKKNRFSEHKDYLLTTNKQSLNIVLLTMLDSGRNFIQDDKLIKQNFFKI